MFQNGVHGEVRGHNSAFQWQIYQDSTGSAWYVECLYCIIGPWYCCWMCLCFLFPAAITESSLLVWCVVFTVPSEPLLCKFADGGQKKRQNQGKYLQNGRPWARDGDTVSWPTLMRNSQRETFCVLVTWSGLKVSYLISLTVLVDCFCSNCTGVCMTSLVVNPVYCFPREEWRLRMTPQPYKMGEWYAHTDWKQSQPSRKERVVFKLWWSAALCCIFQEQKNVVNVAGQMLQIVDMVRLSKVFFSWLCSVCLPASTPHPTVWLQTEWSPRLRFPPTCILLFHPTRWDCLLFIIYTYLL